MQTGFFTACLGLSLLMYHGQALAQLSATEGQAPKAMKLTGQITNADAFDSVRKQSHFRLHVMKMMPGYRYTIDMTAKFDTYLRLEDSQGKQLAANDDFNGLNSRIVFIPPKAGKYRIIATTFGGGASGFYTLTIQPAAIGAAKPLMRVNGRLTAQDPTDAVRKNRHCKIHTLRMQAGRSYVLHCAFQGFDGYLRLEDRNRKQVAENDDYRQSQISRIVFTPVRTGQYRIVVTTFAPGITGAYTLTVTN